MKINWSSVFGGVAAIVSVLAQNAGQLPPKVGAVVTIAGVVIAALSGHAVKKS